MMGKSMWLRKQKEEKGGKGERERRKGKEREGKESRGREGGRRKILGMKREMGKGRRECHLKLRVSTCCHMISVTPFGVLIEKFGGLVSQLLLSVQH